jgi:putative membrane protein (TIGR04086 family)
MNSIFKSYALSLLFIFISILINALVLTILNINNLISYKTSNIIIAISSNVIFFISSLLLGMKIKKKGLINGIILSLIYIFISSLIGLYIYNAIIKSLLITIGSIIGVNIKK